VLAMASVYAHHHEEYRAAGRVIDVTMGILGALILAWTVLRLVQTWDSIDRGQTLLGFAFSLWLPLAVLPFLYVFALVMAYEILFMRLRWKRNGVEPGWPVRLAIFSTLTGRLRAINDLPRHARDLHDVSHAPDYRQARGLLRSYLRQRGEGEGARATASGSGR